MLTSQRPSEIKSQAVVGQKPAGQEESGPGSVNGSTFPAKLAWAASQAMVSFRAPTPKTPNQGSLRHPLITRGE